MLLQNNLSADQRKALAIVRSWWASTSLLLRIDGYAGTGKTTLIKFIVDSLGLRPDQIVIVTTSMRAATVARQKSGLQAYTIARAFYRPVSQSTPRSLEFQRRLNEDVQARRIVVDSEAYETRIIEILAAEETVFKPALSEEVDHASLLIVDEHSMVSLNYRDTMASERKRTILFGDPFQLPSPDRNDQNHPDYLQGQLAYGAFAPAITLREIVRTASNAAGFNICSAALDLRDGRIPQLGSRPGLDIRSMDMAGILADGALLRQMFERTTIVAKHHIRHALTPAIRKAALGEQQCSIVPGDKLLVTRNHPVLGLSNGDLLEVGIDVHLYAVKIPPPTLHDGRPYMHFWTERLDILRRVHRHLTAQLKRKGLSIGLIKPRKRIDIVCPVTRFAWAYQQPFVKYEQLEEPEARDFMLVANQTERAVPGRYLLHLEYGHTITCHKAQGSEFDRTVVIDGGFGNDPETNYRWRYTALTRAKEHCLYLMLGNFGALADIASAVTSPRSRAIIPEEQQ